MREHSNPGRLTIICAAKGGEGSTTVALGIAKALAAADRQVILVEGDPLFGDLAMRLGVEAPQAVRADAGISSQLIPHERGLRLFIPSQSHELDPQIDRERVIGFISDLQLLADHIVVDAPPLRGAQLDVMGLANDVLLVTRPGVVDLKNAIVAARLLEQVGIGAQQTRVVVNGHDKRSDPTRREIERAIGRPVVGTLPDRDTDKWQASISDIARTLIP